MNVTKRLGHFQFWQRLAKANNSGEALMRWIIDEGAIDFWKDRW